MTRHPPTALIWLALGVMRAASIVVLAALSPLFLIHWLLGDLPRKRPRL